MLINTIITTSRIIISSNITIAAADTVSNIVLSLAVALDTVGVLLVRVDMTIASLDTLLFTVEDGASKGMLLFTVEDGDTIAAVVDGVDNGDVIIVVPVDDDFKILVEVVDPKLSEIGGVSTEIIFEDSTLANGTDVILLIVVTGEEYATC